MHDDRPGRGEPAPPALVARRVLRPWSERAGAISIRQLGLVALSVYLLLLVVARVAASNQSHFGILQREVGQPIGSPTFLHNVTAPLGSPVSETGGGPTR